MFPGGAILLSLALVGSLPRGGARAEETSETSFRPHDCIQTEVAAHLDFSCALGVGGPLASPLGLAWGAEWRQETFDSVAGDQASCVVGPFPARAPLPGQANLRAVTTGFSGPGGLTEQGPPTHTIAAALGGVELTEEKSVGLPVGTAMEVAHDLDLTIDYYDIVWDSRSQPRRSGLQLRPESTPWDCSGPFWYSRLFLDS